MYLYEVTVYQVTFAFQPWALAKRYFLLDPSLEDIEKIKSIPGHIVTRHELHKVKFDNHGEFSPELISPEGS